MNSGEIHIRLSGLGKKFGTEWVFKGIDLHVAPTDKLVILGGNGSGKSTLLQIISGYVLPNQGSVIFSLGEKKTEPEFYKNYISMASPYLELIEDFSFAELINHTSIYKPFLNNFSEKEIIGLSELGFAGNKLIHTYSSGMKQRVKLTLAILADAPILLLDEPVSNLDKNAIAWYKGMIEKFAKNKTIIVCSNSISDEFEFCGKELNLVNYK